MVLLHTLLLLFVNGQMNTFLGDGWVDVVRMNGRLEALIQRCATFLGGWLKEQVYSTKPATLVEFKRRPSEVISAILQ